MSTNNPPAVAAAVPVVVMYAPNGAMVYWPVKNGQVSQVIRNLERQGLRPTPPNEYERERRNLVGAIVIRDHENADGTVTPVVDVYIRWPNGFTDRLRSMRVYLNTDYDRQAFEQAFGLALKDVPHYQGDTPIERGKKQNQKKFVQRPKHAVWVIWTLNPASEEDEHAPKRLFVRWEV